MKAEILACTLILGLSTATAVHAGGVAQHSGRAVTQSAQGVYGSAQGSAQVVVGATEAVVAVAAVPITVIEEGGNLDASAADAPLHAEDGGVVPLRVSKDVISVGPSPAQALAR